MSEGAESERAKAEAETLRACGGSRFLEINSGLASQAINAQWMPAKTGEEDYDRILKRTALSMAALKPGDEIEGMLVTQMLAAHAGAMECYRRAMVPDQSLDGRNLNLKYADRLSRVYVELLASLQKYRGKGQQQVTVKHVHVHDGGQAIVGTVQAGGGAVRETEDQPHATERIGDGGSTHVLADRAPLPCADPEGQPVPVSRDAKRSMPNARRHQPRRA